MLLRVSNLFNLVESKAFGGRGAEISVNQRISGLKKILGSSSLAPVLLTLEIIEVNSLVSFSSLSRTSKF